MADVREIFPILEDASGNGVTVAQKVEGDASTGNGMIGFAFKDSAGNVVLPQLGADGRLPVSTQSAGTKKHARGENALGSLVEVTVATLALTASKVYADLNFVVSSRRAAYFKIVQLDNLTETVLADVIVDAGQYTFQGIMNDVIFTAGGTGTQSILIKAISLDKASALRGTVDILELP